METCPLDDSVPVENVLLLAAKQINKASKDMDRSRKVKITQEILAEIADYLIQTEWFETAGDLRVALEDGEAWEWLKIPGALKLQMKKILLPPKPFPPPPPQLHYPQQNLAADSSELPEHWTKEWSAENQAYYYYNTKTGDSSWDAPHNRASLISDYSNEASPYQNEQTPTKSKLVDSSVFAELDLQSDPGECVVQPVNLEEKVRHLLEMGFQETQARAVLEESNNSVEVAVAKLTALNSCHDFVGNV